MSQTTNFNQIHPNSSHPSGSSLIRVPPQIHALCMVLMCYLTGYACAGSRGEKHHRRLGGGGGGGQVKWSYSIGRSGYRYHPRLSIMQHRCWSYYVSLSSHLPTCFSFLVVCKFPLSICITDGISRCFPSSSWISSDY